MKKLFPFLVLLLWGTFSLAQAENEASSEQIRSNPSVGIGTGLDYGGIGIKVSIPAIDHLAFFVSTGYNLDIFTQCIGGTIRILPGNTVVPVVQAMYGYNAVVGSGINKSTYYGFSAGTAIEIHLLKNFGFFNLGVNYALVRSNAYKERASRWGNVANDRTIVSVAYHFKF